MSTINPTDLKSVLASSAALPAAGTTAIEVTAPAAPAADSKKIEQQIHSVTPNWVKEAALAGTLSVVAAALVAACAFATFSQIGAAFPGVLGGMSGTMFAGTAGGVSLLTAAGISAAVIASKSSPLTKTEKMLGNWQAAAEAKIFGEGIGKSPEEHAARVEKRKEKQELLNNWGAAAEAKMFGEEIGTSSEKHAARRGKYEMLKGWQDAAAASLPVEESRSLLSRVFLQLLLFFAQEEQRN